MKFEDMEENLNNLDRKLSLMEILKIFTSKCFVDNTIISFYSSCYLSLYFNDQLNVFRLKLKY